MCSRTQAAAHALARRNIVENVVGYSTFGDSLDENC